MYTDDDADAKCEMSPKDALVLKAHTATDVLKKVLKECYVSATDEDHESNFRYALENLSELVDNLPSLPRSKETTEERRRRKEGEF